MNDRTQFALHIGLHKTGTSYLQRVIFPKFENLHYLHGARELRSLVRDNPGRGPVLISDESLSGTFLGGHWLEEFERNMRAVARLFGDPAVIIGFRRHDDLLLSFYKQYLHRGGTGEVSHLFDPFGGGGLLREEELFFRSRIELLDRLFSRVFVCTREELRDRPMKLISDLEAFLEGAEFSNEPLTESKKNVGVRGVLQAGLLRSLNRLNARLEQLPGSPTLYNETFRRWKFTPRRICQNRLGFIDSAPLELPEKLGDWLREQYREDWQYVLGRTGIRV